MGAGEIISGLVGASIGSVTTFYSPILLERFKARREEKVRVGTFIRRLRSQSRVIVEDFESLSRRSYDLFNDAANEDLVPLGEKLHELCYFAHDGYPAKVLEIHGLVVEFITEAEDVYHRLLSISGRRYLLEGRILTEFDTVWREEHARSVEDLRVKRTQLRDLLEAASTRMKVPFPTGVR